MRWHKYTLRAKSRVILSPRASGAFYKGIDDAEVQFPGEFNIVYPFYQYGEYDSYQGQNAAFYIPGSSIKGALFSKSFTEKLMLDDIPKENWDFMGVPAGVPIVTQVPMKITGLVADADSNRKPNYQEFFPKVGIEMLERGVVCSGRLGMAGDPQQLIDQAVASTKERLKKYGKQLKGIANILATEKIKYERDNAHQEPFDETRAGEAHKIMKELRDRIDQIISSDVKSRQGILFLGGYKGLVRSIDNSIVDKSEAGIVDKSAIFYDTIENEGVLSYLPYGIVEISLCEEEG